MSNIIRFGVSLEKELVQEFDHYLKNNGHASSSEGIRDLIKETLVKEEWKSGEVIAGAISLVYDHHRRELINKLTNTQHDFFQSIISTQHIHLDHNNCLEVIVVKGKPEEVKRLYNKLHSLKGIKHVAFMMTTIGKKIL